MQGYVGNFVGGGGIKSIQTFSDTVTTGNSTKDITITSVDTTSSIIIATQDLRNAVVTYSDYVCSWQLTSSTNLRLTRNGTSGSSDTVSGFIVEFEDNVILSNQYATVALAASATSATQTISSVGTGDTFIIPSGAIQTAGSYGSAQPFPSMVEVTLNSATQIGVTCTNPQTSLDVSYAYQVIEKV